MTNTLTQIARFSPSACGELDDDKVAAFSETETALGLLE